jgi:predicted nucleotidyltransferase
MSQQLVAQIDLPLSKLHTFCEKWQIIEFALFGSVLRADFGPENDIDVLVSLHPEAKRNLFDLV